MNDAQKLAIKKLHGDSWVVDYNFQNEPIIYNHKKDSPTVEEYVIDITGKTFPTANHPFTVKLKKELDLIKKA